jgi:hypothetical protein
MQSSFGIKGFKPNPVSSSDQLKKNYGQLFLDLLDHPIEKTWVLWDRKSESWWTEWPVILQINGVHLEVFVEDMDRLGVSWNSIDLKAPLFENSQGAGDNLEWREDPLDELRNAIAHKIIRISSIEYRHGMQVLRDSQKPDLVGKKIDFGWLLYGIDFELEGAYFGIFNNLSGCAVSNTPLMGKVFRKKVIAKKGRWFGK